MEQEVIQFLIENRNEIMLEVTLNLSRKETLKHRALEVLKSNILKHFDLHIEHVHVILSGIESYEHDLNFFIDEEVYKNKYKISN